jgi:hypothetical protein
MTEMSLRQVVESHLTPYLRTGRLVLRAPVDPWGRPVPDPTAVIIVSRGARVDLSLIDGELDGVVHPAALDTLPPVDLDCAIGVFGRRVPGPRDHAALLFGYMDVLERLEEAAQTRESWLLLVERSDEVAGPPRRAAAVEPSA